MRDRKYKVYIKVVTPKEDNEGVLIESKEFSLGHEFLLYDEKDLLRSIHSRLVREVKFISKNIPKEIDIQKTIRRI